MKEHKLNKTGVENNPCLYYYYSVRNTKTKQREENVYGKQYKSANAEPFFRTSIK